MRFTAAALVLVLAGCAPSLERQAQDVFAHQLFDPSSAQFRDLKRSPDALCGEVNAKNQFGGFVGFKRFIAELPSNDTTLDPGGPEDRPDVDPAAASGDQRIFNVRWEKCRAGQRAT